MDNFGVDPVQQYQFIKSAERAGQAGKTGSEEEFYSLVIEKIFLNRIMASNSFIEEDTEDTEDNFTVPKAGMEFMSEYMRDKIVQELAQNDSFGLKEAFKAKGLGNAGK